MNRKIIGNNLYFFNKIWKNCSKYIVITVLIGVVGSLQSTFVNVLIKNAIDIVTLEDEQLYFTVLVAMFAGYGILLFLINAYYENIFSPKSIEKIKGYILGEIFDKARIIDLKKYDDFDFLNSYQFVLSNSVNSAIKTVNIISGFVNGFFEIVFLLMFMVSIDFKIVLFAVIIAILNYMINFRNAKYSYELSKKNVAYDRHVEYAVRVYYLREFRNDLRLTGLPDVIKSIYTKGLKGVIGNIGEVGKKRMRLDIVQGFLQIFSIIFVLLYLSKSTRSGYITAGGFAAMFSGFNQLIASINGILGVVPEAYNNSLYIEDYRKFVESEIISNGNNDYGGFESVILEEVSFSYDGKKRVLSGISLKIERGEKVGIVGLNGAGKSTLAYLLLGLYRPDSGTVTINGRNYCDFKRAEINKKVGYLEQKFNIYGFSLRENILLDTCRDYELDEKIKEQMKDFGIENKIDEQKGGLDAYLTNELDDDGVFLSLGQAQKIALIRTIIRDFDFTVLDEPSSSLDFISEQEVYRTISEKNEDSTLVVISHKLANLRNMDRIYFIKEGKLIEEGTHSELMNMKGEYYGLYSRQQKHYSGTF